MQVIPREICRDTDRALQYEWLVGNGQGSYAAGSISGAVTRRQHGLLVAALPSHDKRLVLLAKLDEEVEVEGHLYKLGANEYLNNVISPDGFLYLKQVILEERVTTFEYEAGRFRLTKQIWMDSGRPTTYIRYTLPESSEPIRLTLLPLCDYRFSDELTTGDEKRHMEITREAHGFRVTAQEDAAPYRILVMPDAEFTPLDLWYWRFQLRRDSNAGTDLYVPGLVRIELLPGASVTVVATCAADRIEASDADRALALARQPKPTRRLPNPDEFTPELFASPDL